MRENILFSLDTPYRQSLLVKGWYFGNPEQKSLAVMGAMRGDEVQQMYICAQLIQSLAKLEQEGALSAQCGILVIPCANQASMNVGRRFWAADNTDINRMFPGYGEGETTQRIAQRIFSALQGYQYGIHVTSLYVPGRSLPHVRIMETGYDHPEEANDFGLPYTVLRKPHPYDTTTLNYNWQIWDTQAFSLYSGETTEVDPVSARQAVDAVLRFLAGKGLCRPVVQGGEPTRIFHEEELHNVLATTGGLLVQRLALGAHAAAGDLLADVLNPFTGAVAEHLRTQVDGRVFFIHRSHLINGHDVAYRILPEQG